MSKNLLLLLPEDNLTIFEQSYRTFQKLFTHTYRLNYLDFFKKQGLLKLEDEILQTIKKQAIDTVILFRHVDSFVLTPHFLQTIKTDNTRLLFFFFDDEMCQHSVSKYYAQVASGIVTTDYFGSFYYEQIGIPCVVYFSGYPQEIYYKEDVAKDIDVSFVGNMLKQDRQEYIDYLEAKGIRVETFGVGSKNGFVNEDDFRTVFSKSKINLNFTKTEPRLYEYNREDPLSLKTRQNKGRPIEIAMCGGFCLSEYSYTLDKLFIPGEEIDFFTSKEELYQKIKFYLSHEQEAETMAKKAYTRAQNEYEAQTYLQKVFDSLDKKMQSHIVYDDTLYFNQHFLSFQSQLFFRYSLRSLRFGPKEFLHTLKRGLYPYRFVNFSGYLKGGIRIFNDIYNKYLVYKALKRRSKTDV